MTPPDPQLKPDQVARPCQDEPGRDARLIHISFAGPEYHLNADKQYCFEDHRYCGPIVLGKDGDPLGNQPPERSRFWPHVNAWYQQGKKFKTVDGKKWCIYTTDMQEKRSAGCVVRKEMTK